ncbi:glutamate receptor ionotropic, NMDA 2B [Paragonimus westermani]|uniref:Glutamate receptor ionotropic, NMDA 2B n=1 Tax=Paragonimus westermani TaxID=34504 RepID=A0A5J4P1F2_9TREM|nr:glutamate receptor ionotropic, NMDA 2B [Paragonimus westermani]
MPQRSDSSTVYIDTVGTWSMSSKWGRLKSRLRIDGVTWPGGSNSPPKGRPSKLKLRVVTIREKPFVIYNRLQEDGSCDANSIPCKLRPQSIVDMDSPLHEAGGSKTGSVQFRPVSTIQLHLDMNSTTVTDRKENQNAMTAPNITQYIDGCCSGLTMDLLIELMKDLNFEVELYEVADGLWGAWTPDGWNGIIRTLMDHKADMAVTSLKITPNRSQQVEFSVPFLETGIAVIVALREGAISPTAFLKPYDYQSWCVILVFSVHASGAALFIFEWFSPNGLDRGQTVGHRFSLFRSLWLIWSMLFGAAVNADNPRGVASRFLANIWALFALVFLASYTANLAAFMIAKEDFYDLSGMNDWRLQQPWNVKPPFRFATIPSGATEENIKINFPEMAIYMHKFNRSTVEEGLKSLKAGDLDAFLYDANVLDYWASKDENCKLRIVGNLYAMTGYGIGFAKGSRWVEKVNSRILDYQKNGKFQRWKKFWQTGSCRKDAALGNTNKTLGVKNFISAFILLLCGIVICGLILLIEIAIYRYFRSKKIPCLSNNKVCKWIPVCTGTGITNQRFRIRPTEESKPRKLSSDTDYTYKMEILIRENDALREKLQQLQSLIDITTKPDARCTTPEEQVLARPETFTTHSGRSRRKLADESPNTMEVSSGAKRPSRRPKNTKTTLGQRRMRQKEKNKVWDVYSKVAVIPIEPTTSIYYKCAHEPTESLEGEPHAIILPKLSSSPSKRRRFLTPTNQNNEKSFARYDQPQKNVMASTEQSSHSSISPKIEENYWLKYGAKELTYALGPPDHVVNTPRRRIYPSTVPFGASADCQNRSEHHSPHNFRETVRKPISISGSRRAHRELRFLKTDVDEQQVDVIGQNLDREIRDNEQVHVGTHFQDTIEKESVL